MSANHQIFKASSFTTWKAMADEVTDFLNRLGKENIIGLTQSEDNGTAVIIVWYWD